MSEFVDANGVSGYINFHHEEPEGVPMIEDTAVEAFHAKWGQFEIVGKATWVVGGRFDRQAEQDDGTSPKESPET